MADLVSCNVVYCNAAMQCDVCTAVLQCNVTTVLYCTHGQFPVSLAGILIYYTSILYSTVLYYLSNLGHIWHVIYYIYTQGSAEPVLAEWLCGCSYMTLCGTCTHTHTRTHVRTRTHTHTHTHTLTHTHVRLQQPYN